MSFIRTIAFNLLFYPVTAIMCLILIPTLLMPRDKILIVVRLWTGTVHFLEKYILGLKLEVRGLEHLPKDEAYIVAAKHQSAYETMKLHYVFDDPSIVLKEELLRIPIFGNFLKNVDMIAINRKNRDSAMKSIVDGALRMKEQGRQIVIFPQGTRVKPEASSKDKPYKFGIAKMYEDSGLKIIPMALNSGMYWPRNAFFKRPGTVVFEFLPAIETGQDKKIMMKNLEDSLEKSSILLMEEAKQSLPALETIKLPELPKA